MSGDQNLTIIVTFIFIISIRWVINMFVYIQMYVSIFLSKNFNCIFLFLKRKKMFWFFKNKLFKKIKYAFAYFAHGKIKTIWENRFTKYKNWYIKLSVEIYLLNYLSYNFNLY